jgi:hypothetical protein
MIPSIRSCVIGLVLLVAGFGNLHAAPVKIIFDTDLATDCDDVGALAVLNHLSDLGEAEILACIADGPDNQKAIAASISAINTYYGRPNIPIGTYQGTRGQVAQAHYTAHLRDEFPHHALPDDQMPKALEIYRKTLSAAPDGSVTIVCVGFMLDLRELIESPADAISPLSGLDLIKAKVKHLVVMGGNFPGGTGGSPDYNLSANQSQGAGDARVVVEKWPTEILFSGGEIGNGISTGPSLVATPLTNPVRRAYDFNGVLTGGRQSWDQTAALAAVRDPELYWHVVRHGYCKIADNGAMEWLPNVDRGHAYLQVKVPPAEMAKTIGDLMAAPPARK